MYMRNLKKNIVRYLVKQLLGPIGPYFAASNADAREFLKKIHGTRGFEQYCEQRYYNLKEHLTVCKTIEELENTQGAIEELRRLRVFAEAAAKRTEKEKDTD